MEKVSTDVLDRATELQLEVELDGMTGLLPSPVKTAGFRSSLWDKISDFLRWKGYEYC